MSMYEEGPEGDAGTSGGDTTQADTAPEWDGDFGSIDKQPWWATVPETARGHISKAHEERTSATNRANYLDRVFSADDAVSALRTELAERDKVISGLKESLSKTESTAKDHESRARGLEERFAEAEEDKHFETLKAKFADIFADVHLTEDKKSVDQTKGAYPRFVSLVHAGLSEDDAATAARAFLTQPAAQAEQRPKERTTVLPKSVAAASAGGSTAKATASAAQANETFEARYKRLEKEAALDEKAASKVG